MRLLLCADLVRFYAEEVRGAEKHSARDADRDENHNPSAGFRRPKRRDDRDAGVDAGIDGDDDDDDDDHGGDHDGNNDDDLDDGDDNDDDDNLDSSFSFTVRGGGGGGGGGSGSRNGKRKAASGTSGRLGGQRAVALTPTSSSLHIGGSSRDGRSRRGRGSVQGGSARKRARVTDPWENVLGAIVAQTPRPIGSSNGGVSSNAERSSTSSRNDGGR